MEPEAADIESAIMALAAISAIPVVIYALWADYFERHVHQLTIKRPQTDYQGEVETIRITGFLVILFELALFLGSVEVRAVYPLVTLAIFGGASLVQIFLQAGLERKLVPIEKKPDNLLELGARAALSWTLGVTIHVFILAVFIKLASWTVVKLALPALPSFILMICSGVLGLIGGLCLNFALSPYHLRKLLPSTPLIDSQVTSMLEKCFAKAGVTLPKFWIIELKQYRIVNILSVGFQTHLRPFRPAMFICRPILNILSDQELEAVVLNEVSHQSLRHLRKRFLLTSLLILVTAAIAILTIVVGQRFLPKEWVADVLGPTVAFISFLASLRCLGWQRKNHELEGDLYSIEKLGVSPEQLSSALRKLDLSMIKLPVKEDVPVSPATPLLGFPETEERIQLIQHRLRSETKVSANQRTLETKTSEDSSEKRAA